MQVNLRPSHDVLRNTPIPDQWKYVRDTNMEKRESFEVRASVSSSMKSRVTSQLPEAGESGFGMFTGY